MNDAQKLNENNQKEHPMLVGFLSFFVVFSLLVIYPYINNKINKPQEKIVNIKDSTAFFENLDIEAKAFFVWDARERRSIYGFNEEKQLPLASLTKLMTVLIASESIPLNTILTIDENNLAEEGDSGLYLNERWKLSDLINLTLIASSNDGANAVASVARFWRKDNSGMTAEDSFLEEMNKKATEIGLNQTIFLNTTGLDPTEDSAGAYGSAKDVTLLTEYILNNNHKLLEATIYSNFNIKSKDFTHNIKNTNKNVEKIPGIIASKTGFTDLAGGNLVIAYDTGIGHPIIISVLGSSQEGRFNDMDKLIQASTEYFASGLYQ